VPLALPRRDPDRLQEASAGPARGRAVAVVRPGPVGPHGQAARRVAQRRRPGRVDRRAHRRLLPAGGLRRGPVPGAGRRLGHRATADGATPGG
jgi:hypothetical protein